MESTNYNDSDYKEIKPHAFFTTQAEKILNFHDNTPLDYLDGWALEELNSILSIDVPPKTKEEYLMKTMLDDEFKQRVVTKSFFTHEKDNEIVPYFQVEGNKKKLPKRIEDVGIDFELVAENLFKNFLNLSLFWEFPDEQALHVFLQKNSQLSFSTLKYQVESYLDTREEDDLEYDEDDNEWEERKLGTSTVIGNNLNQEPLPWHAYLGASMLLWKSVSFQDMCDAVELLAAAEIRVENIYNAFQRENVQWEFQMGGSESLERYLWTLTCDTVHYNREEICRRINDEIKLENSWLVELYANGSVYMMPKNNKEKEKANYNLFCLYDDLCTELTQGGQPDDIDGYSEEI